MKKLILTILLSVSLSTVFAAAPTTYQQPAANQQRATNQQPTAYQQPAANQQRATNQQPTAYQQPAANQQPAASNNAALYHGYEGKQYVADSSDATTAYVTTANAEKFRPLRVQVFVPGLFIGRFGATIDYKLNNAFAIGGLYRTYSRTGQDDFCSDYGTSCSHQDYKDFYNVYGLNMEYAVNGNLNMDGWILNPRILQAHYQFHDGYTDSDKTQKVNQAQTSSDLGIYLMHQWAWPTGIYMQLGIGADYMSNPNNNIFGLTKSNFGGDWDYTIGFQF